MAHEVSSLEDCGRESWVYNWDSGEMTTEVKYPAAAIQNGREPLGVGGAWIYRQVPETKGSSLEQIEALWSPESAPPRRLADQKTNT